MKKTYIIGAGPAGLAAAYKLLKETDVKPVILEETSDIGGISRTHRFDENLMDLGGHRFFTKSDEVMEFWLSFADIQEMPSRDDIILNNLAKYKETGVNPETQDNVLLIRRRLSRMFFLKKFFDYPLKLNFESFKNLGLKNIITIGFGYLISCIIKRKENTLEDFYINRFGKPLYEMFFEGYTEKLWGTHPSKLSPEWGAQRVKGLSLLSAIKDSIFKKEGKDVETSLIKEFYYPKYGVGQLYELAKEKITEMGGTILFNRKVSKLDFNGDKITHIHTMNNENQEEIFECDEVFSSMPVKDLFKAFNKEIDKNIRQVGENLAYRDFMTTGLLVKKLAVKNQTEFKTVSDIIPDCWIYIQEKNVKIGRLQIFNNWSPYLVKDFENYVMLGLEYFCDEGDEMWTCDDNKFIEFASDELSKIGIINKEDIIKGTVVRVKKAYPKYTGCYSEFPKVIEYLNTIENLYCIGRNGQHRYNNMDHSILTAFRAVDASLGKCDKKIIWNVNTEKEYHETKN